MRRTVALLAVAFASLAAAAVAALLRPALPSPPPSQAGALRLGASLDRQYLPRDPGGEAYLRIDLAAPEGEAQRQRVPVNAVLVLDRSGSMTGAKIDRARDAARALAQALGPGDSLAVVEFGSEASVLFSSAPMTPEARARVLEAIAALEPIGGTNLSAALQLAAGELRRGAAPGRVDKVFLASDGQANVGVSDRDGLLRLARADLAGATLSTFGMGDDFDEDLLAALAAQSGGRTRFIASPEILPRAFADELSRTAATVAREVLVCIEGPAERVAGYQLESGCVRLPDFAAGEERRVLAKLRVPPGQGRAEVARVRLRYLAGGTAREAETAVQATYTAEAALLSQAPGAPAEQYERLQQVVQAAGAAASKEVKQRAFDAVRAPVAGW